MGEIVSRQFGNIPGRDWLPVVRHFADFPVKPGLSAQYHDSVARTVRLFAAAFSLVVDIFDRHGFACQEPNELA